MSCIIVILSETCRHTHTRTHACTHTHTLTHYTHYTLPVGSPAIVPCADQAILTHWSLYLDSSRECHWPHRHFHCLPHLNKQRKICTVYTIHMYILNVWNNFSCMHVCLKWAKRRESVVEYCDVQAQYIHDTQ